MSTFSPRWMCLLAVALAMIIGLSSLNAQQQGPPQEQVYSAVLKVPTMCCGKESGPAIAEISKIPGVVKVVPDYKHRTLIISPANNNAVSHRAIWEAAERAQVPPTELATIFGIYKSKPQR